MSQRDQYKSAIEAVGMCAATATPIRNKLRKASDHSDDPHLRSLIEALLNQHRFASHCPAIPVAQMARCKDSASTLVAYCRAKIDEERLTE